MRNQHKNINFIKELIFTLILCHRLSGLSPFMGSNDAETFANITRAEFDFDDETFGAISQDAKDFISALLLKRKEWVVFYVVLAMGALIRYWIWLTDLIFQETINRQTMSAA